MSKNLKNTIIYKEAQHMGDPSVVSFSEDELSTEKADSADVLTFSEDPREMTLEEVLEPFVEGENDFKDIAEEAEELHEEVEEIIEEHGDMKLSDLLPGADVSISEFKDEDDNKETDYENDKDLTKFMDHVLALYPAKIPRHDGTSTVGCERAISFLDRLNGDISRAIREDHDSVLDITRLEDIRLNIMRDVMVLKDHLTKLKRQIRDSHSKSSSDASLNENIKKVAGTPANMVIAVTPFERAISGIMINAHVSAGHPMEEVFDFLCEKYDLSDREKLSIMQLCMDSGFHIFKDRGSISSEDGDGDRGVDFLRNYLA